MNPTVEQVVHQLLAVAPANVLLLAGVVVLALGLIPRRADGTTMRNVAGALSLLSLGLAAAVALLQQPASGLPADALFVADPVAQRGAWLALLAGALLVLVGWEQVVLSRAAEHYGWLLLLLAGLIYTAAANDLTSLFLSLELVSLPTVVLLGISRNDDAGREATLKYFTLAAFASTFFLLGCSYLYGVSGSTALPAVQAALVERPSLLGAVALTLVVLGLAFRVTAVPFHFYAPDVFSGATAPMAAALSFVPKLAGFLALIRLLGGERLIPDFPPLLTLLILALATLTMTIGNCAALVQTNLRRLMAYSSIAHSGYLLVGLAAILSVGGSTAPIFDYLAAYLVMTIGVFAVVGALPFDRTTPEELTSLDGLFRRAPLAAVALSIALLSLTGIPLTAGFWAKLQIFLTTITAENTPVLIAAVLMAVNAAIAAVYYLALLARLFQAEGAAPSARPTGRVAWAASLAAFVCSALTIVWFFIP